MLPANAIRMTKVGGFGSHTTYRFEVDLNGGSHRVTLDEIKFFNAAGVQISTVGATFSEGGTGVLNAPAVNACDGSLATHWSRASTGGGGCWWQITFPAPVPVAKIQMWSASWGGSYDESPIVARWRRSDDGGATLTTMFEMWEPSWDRTVQVMREWPQDTSAGKFKAYAWFPTLSNDGSHMAMDEVQVFVGGGAVDQTVPNTGYASVPTILSQNLVDNVATNWCEVGATNRWVAAVFPTPLKATGYSVAKNVWLTEAWKNWTLKGTNDGVNFTLVDTQNNQSFAVAQTKTYAL